MSPDNQDPTHSREQQSVPVDALSEHDVEANNTDENLSIENRIEPVLRTVGRVALSPIKLHNKLIGKAWNYHKGIAVSLVAAEAFMLAKGLAYTAGPSDEAAAQCNDAGHQMVQLGGNNMVENSAQTVADAPGRMFDKVMRSFGDSSYIGYRRSTQAAANEVQKSAGYDISPARLAQANPDLFIDKDGDMRNGPTEFGAACLSVPGPIVYGFSETDGDTSIKEYAKKYLITPRQFIALNPGLPHDSDFLPPAGMVVKWTEDYDPTLVLRELTEDRLIDVVKGKRKQENSRRLVEANSFALIQSENIEPGDTAYLPLRLTDFHKEYDIDAQDIRNEYASDYAKLPKSQSIEPAEGSRSTNVVLSRYSQRNQFVIESLKQRGPEWEHRAEAMQFFMDEGLTDYQAAAIIGNFQVETGSQTLPSSQKQFGGGPGRGLAQWEAGARFEDLKQFAHNMGTPWHDFFTQLKFVMHEFATTEKRAYRKLIATKNVVGATSSVLNDYERPAARILEPRLNAAKDILTAYRYGLTDIPGDA